MGKSTWFSQWWSQLIYLGGMGTCGLFPIFFSLANFHTHLYAVGASGQGKSKFLQHLLFELATKGWGCGVFDPHSDLANDLLGQLASYPQPRPWFSHPANQKRLILLDPARSDYLIPANI